MNNNEKKQKIQKAYLKFQKKIHKIRIKQKDIINDFIKKTEKQKLEKARQKLTNI